MPVCLTVITFASFYLYLRTIQLYHHWIEPLSASESTEWDQRASDNDKPHPQQRSSTLSTTPQLTSKYTSRDPTRHPPTEHLCCTHVHSHFQAHRHVHTHPGAHLLSKSRKKCGQFSKSLPRTLMRFPMAGDLDGRKQHNAYSMQNLATRRKTHMHMENTAGCECLISSFFYPSALC